jgi:nitroimidazol reductase NimA-like FMN-containing flavoprotein (pyridoxamine 5'-phosphate oxidase superfamily)
VRETSARPLADAPILTVGQASTAATANPPATSAAASNVSNQPRILIAPVLPTLRPMSVPAGRGTPRELSSTEIDDFLRGQRIARLGCHTGGETYVVPLIYAYEDGVLVAVTTEGRKTAMLRENPRVCVEVDEYDADGRGSWRSVIAYGTYDELAGDAIGSALTLLRERFFRAAGRAAEPRPLGPDVVVIRITLDEISGRAVER